MPAVAHFEPPASLRAFFFLWPHLLLLLSPTTLFHNNNNEISIGERKKKKKNLYSLVGGKPEWFSCVKCVG
jgi:hypothetical protein